MGTVAGSADPGNGGVGLAPSRRLAAIMFTDLVGYSALAHRDERLAIELLELHRRMVREILPRHDGAEIETVGDAFLIEFAGALAAVECALAIQQGFASYNARADAARRMQLRIGIHVGDVEHKDGKVMGDGVNIASRIHDQAEPGGICVSDPVHQAVRSRGLAFVNLGAPALKNIEPPPQLYALGAVAAPAVRRGRAAAVLRRSFLAAAAVAVLATTGLLAWRLASAPVGASAEKSVAVLPFANLSSEKDSEYFADGIHDTVITHLARVKDLKTISRTSVMEYRDARRNLREIGRALGVAHVVEGSVQRAGARVRVTAQLIRVANDEHVWAENYDRDIADVFGIQSDIAQRVAAGVRASLSPGELGSIARRPTGDTEAYDLYLRARSFWLSNKVRTEQEWRDALALLERAVARDPKFALAHALDSQMRSALHWFFKGRGAVEPAARSAERALSLQPDLAEGHIAHALHLYWGRRDYGAALAALERAREAAPGNAEVPLWAGYIFRRQGRWQESLAQLEQATLLDPANEDAILAHAFSLQELLRYADAEHLFDRAIAMDLSPGFNRLSKAYVSFLRTGDLHALKEAADHARSDDPASLLYALYEVRLMSREFDRAATTVMENPEDIFLGTGGEAIPRQSFAALALMLGGDLRRAAPHARQAARFLEAQLDGNAPRPLVRMHLAVAREAEGRREEALAEAQRAREDARAIDDAVIRAWFLRLACAFFTRVGEDDLALDLIAEALRTPYALHLEEVRHHPAFDRLRADARFRQLLEHPPERG